MALTARGSVLHPICTFFLAMAVAMLAGREVTAQQTTVRTPIQSVGSSFFESTNVGFSLNMPGVFARFGGTPAVPQFGGFTPNAGLNGGFAIGGGGGLGANFNFNFAQGGSRSIVSSTPMITGINGYPNSLTIGTQRPFVTGLVPVLGSGALSPLRPPFEDLGPANTVAGRLQRGEFQMRNGRVIAPGVATPSVELDAQPENTSPAASRIDPLPPTRAERQQQQAAAEATQQLAARRYFDRGTQALADDKPKVARLYFRMAARRATGDLSDEIAAQLARLESRLASAQD